MLKPTISAIKSRQNRYDAVIDIRREAIEATIQTKLRSKRTPFSLQGRPVDPSHAALPSSSINSLFQTWRENPATSTPLHIIIPEFRSRANPPIDELAALFAASGLNWLVGALQGASTDYLDEITELFSFLSKVDTPEFSAAVTESGFCPFLQTLLTGSELPPPGTVKNILWFWANLPGESLKERDYLLHLGVLTVVTDYLTLNAGVDECLETAAWLLERLTSGLPVPDFVAIHPIIPLLQPMLDYSLTNRSGEMQIDLVKVLINLIRFDTGLLQDLLTPQLLKTVMTCIDQTNNTKVTKLCLNFFIELTNCSNKFCEILLDQGFVDFLESRIRRNFPNNKDEEYVAIVKCLINLLFGTGRLGQILLSRDFLCEAIKIMIDSGVYDVIIEALFLVANGFYAASTFEELIAVGDLDEARDMIFWITGRDPALSEMILVGLDKALQLIISNSGDPSVDRDQLMSFCNAWFLSDTMENVLSDFVSPDREVNPRAFATATGLIDRIGGLKLIFEMTEDAALQSMRELIHNKYEF